MKDRESAETRPAGHHGSLEPPQKETRPGILRRIWDYFFGRSEPPEHPPPPPHSPGAGM
ncbi:MAG: hypothetical protein ACLFRT_02140 [Actinomycetota bacterium]